MNLTSFLDLVSNPADENSAVAIESKLPFAEVDADGIVRRVNSLAKIAWGWEKGTRIPHHLGIVLAGVSDLEATELPLQLGGLLIGVIPQPTNNAWLLIGYAPRETNIRDAIVLKNGARSLNHHESVQSEIPDRTPEDEDLQIRRKESLSNAKMAFIATLSHEIRSPIGSIAGYTELLVKELAEYQERSGQELPELIFEFLRALQERTTSLRRLVQDLFELSELHGHDQAVESESVDLNEILHQAAARSRPLLENTPVDLKLVLSDSPIMVQSDMKRLRQIIDSVLSNAIKFTDSGEILIRSKLYPGSAVVEIEDTGIGICEEFIPEIFDALSQEDSRRSRAYDGIGMGLALTRRLLDRLGGSIEVTSKKGSGSLFRIQLPVASEDKNDSVGRGAIRGTTVKNDYGTVSRRDSSSVSNFAKRA